MDYQYENLGDERFQEFCSILISKEFPNTQAYPVGQPDGGRDSLAYSMSSSAKKFIVFQVKFVRNPQSVKEPHKWLIATIEDEIEKISRLIPKGANGYYLLTNVKGTGHLDVGSKDRLNKLLEEKMTIPALCWWREDITVLFEKDPLFKWSFPEIISGQDILNFALFNNLTENKERRESVLRAYLVDQYRQDDEVKFKQIDLQNRLIDLFTDVPIQIKKFNEKDKRLKELLYLFISRNLFWGVEENLFSESKEPQRAASFLLHPKVQTGIPRILLEGGPGQGKSTISQYVCQVHRARLLKKTYDISAIPDIDKNTPVRLPIKIDLRHIAAWVENKNPYQSVLNDESFKKIWNKSLESFLVGHIFYHSKLEGFNSNDFVAICRLTPLLFVFDGFDEIASQEVRKDVIDFINKGLNRISENSKSIQVIITSRPSVFSDSVGFSIESYPHLELANITPEITNEYVSKWIKANRLDSKEASEIKRLVAEKLEMPHLKELAKSPMQLAIFISLLRTKGESLPNKRTALYDSYIELLFDRESEKSSIIRDNRDLIIDIHQYLAWVLHSEAELYKNSGSITVDSLINLLKSYLSQEGHTADITKLFDVVKDRVCALASRVQGTFEFEVQPLREYFCARYLYNTSPYSPTGRERPGTLPDRFDAISKNPYWQNVARFFAGCFSKGELSMLIQKLKELQNDHGLKFTNHPRLLTSQLLSDYVFTQYPILLKDVVSIIIDGINMGIIINQDKSGLNADNIVVPFECGRVEIVNACFNELKKIPSNHYSNHLIGIIKNNPWQVVKIWSENVNFFSGDDLTKWLDYAYLLEIIHLIDGETLINILEEGNENQLKRRIQILLYGNRMDILQGIDKYKKILFEGILDHYFIFNSKVSSSKSLHFLQLVFGTYQISSIMSISLRSISFGVYLLQRNGHRHIKKDDLLSMVKFEIKDEIDRKIEKFCDLIKPELNIEISSFLSSLYHWDRIVESGRTVFNENWSLIIMSNIAAGIKSKDEKYDDYDNLNDINISLCKRVRCARMKSGNIKYWEANLTKEGDAVFQLLILFTWATPKTIIGLLPIITTMVSKLDRMQFIKLVNALRRSIANSVFTPVQLTILKKHFDDNKISDSIVFLISARVDHSHRNRFVYDYIKDFSEILEVAKMFKLEYLIEAFLLDTANEALLSEVKILFIQNDNYRESYRRQDDSVKIPLEIAKKIMMDSKNYPSIITFYAERACRIAAYKELVPVGEVATIERWF